MVARAKTLYMGVSQKESSSCSVFEHWRRIGVKLPYFNFFLFFFVFVTSSQVIVSHLAVAISQAQLSAIFT